MLHSHCQKKEKVNIFVVLIYCGTNVERQRNEGSWCLVKFYLLKLEKDVSSDLRLWNFKIFILHESFINNWFSQLAICLCVGLFVPISFGDSWTMPFNYHFYMLHTVESRVQHCILMIHMTWNSWNYDITIL